MSELEKRENWNVDQVRSRLNLAENDDEYLSKRSRWSLAIILGVVVGIVALVLYVVTRPRLANTGLADARVAATIFPVYDIARNVSEGVTGVVLVLPPGASPHTFEPSPRLVASLQNVEVFYAVGHGLDEWSFDLVSEKVEKVIMDKGLAIIDIEDRHREGFDLGDADEHGGTDPHYWLSIPNGQMIARTIAEDLTRRFPEQEDRIEENLDGYLKELSLAEAGIRNDFVDIRNRKMVTMHDAWYYFAVHYGFDIVGTFEPAPGREPTPRYLAELTDAVSGFEARVIYSEPQISTRSIEAFARDRGLTIAELDPVGGVPGRDTYRKLMQYNAGVIRDNQE